MQTLPHSVDQILGLFDNAVQQEISWTAHIVGNDVLGITENSTEEYTKYLANIRLKAIGLPTLYDTAKYSRSPYAHLERASDTKGDANVKANFFESGVTSYVMSSGLTGWDDI